MSENLKKRAILDLVNSFPQSEGIDYEIFFRAAFLALEGCSEQAIVRAVEKFLTGAVERKG
ncbi:hypothetical protein, partial [Candidatus Tokpelaia sp.]|uniref:hypothetical protein n=1 Tax=Candidatus Tokpelaia sp. TaxID=2233777 RepID=UPI00128AD1B0